MTNRIIARLDKRILLIDIKILVILGNLVCGIIYPFQWILKAYSLEERVIFLYSLGEIPTYFLKRREK
jgi:hypothetical protein